MIPNPNQSESSSGASDIRPDPNSIRDVRLQSAPRPLQDLPHVKGSGWVEGSAAKEEGDDGRVCDLEAQKAVGAELEQTACRAARRVRADRSFEPLYIGGGVRPGHFEPAETYNQPN